MNRSAPAQGIFDDQPSHLVKTFTFAAEIYLWSFLPYTPGASLVLNDIPILSAVP